MNNNLLFVINDLEDISLNRAVLTLARKINKKKFNVWVISLSSCGGLDSSFKKLKKVEFLSCVNLVNGLFTTLSYLFSNHSCLIHTQTLRADLIVFLGRLVTAFSHHRIVHICVRRNYLFPKDKFWHRIKNLFYFLSCRLADLNVCVARHLENKLVSELKIPRNKVVTIANGVNIMRKFSKRYSRKIPLVIFTGRLIPRKNVTILLQAMKRISLSFRCLIIGDGEDLFDLKNYCQLSGIQNRIEFLGHKTDVAPYLSKSDIFVLPSWDEGLSWSLLEAMSYGLACIVSDVDGSVELIKNGYNGLIFKLREGEAGLANCLRRLVADHKLRQKLGVNARKTVTENYAESAMINSYQKLYLRMANFDRAVSAATVAR